MVNDPVMAPPAESFQREQANDPIPNPADLDQVS